jgi:hypothetical protein
MFQYNPAPERNLEDQLRALVPAEGEKVANVCRLIHITSGLLSESPLCKDSDYVLEMARRIVSSHQCEDSNAPGGEPFDEEMYLGLLQNEGERVADLSRQIYDACDLSSNVDWCLLIDNARWILSPYCGEESEAQANIVIGFRGIRLQED